MSEARIGHVRTCARGVLKKYAITSPPVDVGAVARGEGLEVRLVDTWPKTMSGLLLREDHLIGINAAHASTRRRFSLAHELGHWFLRHDVAWHERGITIDEPPDIVIAGNPIEAEADEFAGELLAPREFLKAALRKTKDAAALADLFDMSEEAIWVRLLRHRLL
jgi:Zn-dependent peptidase ImmA (M78 family)